MADDIVRSQRDKVLELQKPGSPARDRSLEKFVGYWSRMRRNGDVPLRTEIDPRGIEALLGNAFIAEKIAPGLVRLRIAGSHLSDIMGMEVRGMPLSALIEPDHRDQLADAVVDLFDRPAQIRVDLASTGGLRRAPLAATLLILPLRSDLGDISRALGCLVSSGTIGTAPRRFQIRDVQITPIDLPKEGALVGFAEMPEPFVPRPTEPPAHVQLGPSERSYLRLVRDE